MAYHPEDNGTFCATCGRERDPRARFCSYCGAAAGPESGGRVVHQSGPSLQPTYVPNYLVQAILVTICCCIPGGIVAIVYAAQVNGRLAAGDYAGAANASNSAKGWCWASFWIGLVVYGLSFLARLALGG